jgi:hypothetical protein
VGSQLDLSDGRAPTRLQLLAASAARRVIPAFFQLSVVAVDFLTGCLALDAGPSFPVLGAPRDAVFSVGLLVATCASSIASVAWSSSISELVPERLGSRYFARRNLGADCPGHVVPCTPGLDLAHLYAGYFVVGAMTAGFQLMQFNLMVRLAPPQLRSAYVAVFLALSSLLTALGPVLGGQALKLLPLQVGLLFGVPILSFHLSFALSAAGCLLVTNLVQQVHEPAEQPVVTDWREMKSMRNPMLSVLAVGELLLTPRGLFALGQRSLRTVRQQVKGAGGSRRRTRDRRTRSTDGVGCPKSEARNPKEH